MRNYVAVVGARWFLPNGTLVCTETYRLTGHNDPYFRNNVPGHGVLIIREFVHPYNGTYSCGPNINFNDASSQGDTINTLANMNNF